MDILNSGEDLVWWKNITEPYEVRDLNEGDMDKISELIETKPTFWKSLPLSTVEVKKYIDFYAEKFKDPDRWKCVGAFLDNKLVMETSGYFPLKVNFWYSTSLRHDTNNQSLLSGNLQRYLFADCFIPLIENGEKLKKFSFYAMRSVAHQRVINKMWDRTRPDSPLKRYEYFIDGFVQANTINSNMVYNIFFPENKTYDIDLVVYLHCLKHPIRVNILKEKFNLKI